jgi:hypothetical protein
VGSLYMMRLAPEFRVPSMHILMRDGSFGGEVGSTYYTSRNVQGWAGRCKQLHSQSAVPRCAICRYRVGQVLGVSNPTL